MTYSIPNQAVAGLVGMAGNIEIEKKAYRDDLKLPRPLLDKHK
jgi:hypothetical protein